MIACPERCWFQYDESRGRIVEYAVLESSPAALVGSQIATSPAASPIGVEAPDLGRSAGVDLQHVTALQIAGIDHEGNAWVSIDQPPELRPPSREPPKGMFFPQVPDRAHGRTDQSTCCDTREDRFSEEAVQVETFLDRPTFACPPVAHRVMIPRESPPPAGAKTRAGHGFPCGVVPIQGHRRQGIACRSALDHLKGIT